jgi:drug/metabolite transporter (DMT)-like permease
VPTTTRSTRLDAATAAFLVAGMACFGSATPVSKIVGDGFPVWLASCLRMATAAVALIVTLAALGGTGAFGRLRSTVVQLDAEDRVRLTAIAVVGAFLFSVFMLLGMRNAPGAVGAVVMATTPAVTGVGAVVYLRESIDRMLVVAIVIAFSGIVFVNLTADAAQGTGDRLVLGSALVFAAVCCEATYTLLGKRLSVDLTPVQITLVAAGGAFFLFVPMALWDLLRFRWSAPDGGEWIGLIWWGAGTMGLGSWLWFRGMQRVEGSTAAPFMAVMPLSALLLSYLLLDEAFQWPHAVGMGAVLVSLVIAVRRGG